MLGLIWLNIRYRKAKLNERNFKAIMARIKRSTILYKIVMILALVGIAYATLTPIFQGWLEDKIGDKAEFLFNPNVYGWTGLISAALFAITGYIVFFANRIRVSAANILVKRSSELISRTFEKDNLSSKSVIITNLTNGKELGFTSDSAIVAVIPKRNALTIFEMFIEFVKIGSKRFPVFKNEKAKVVSIPNADLKQFADYFERGNYVPKEVKVGIESLIKNKKHIVEYGMDIEEVIAPQENTVIELVTTNARIGFRAYKFKEILSGVYPDIITKTSEATLQSENARLKQQVTRYKAKLMQMED